MTAPLDSKLQLSLVMKIDSPVNRVSRRLQLQAMLPAASCRQAAGCWLLVVRSRVIVYPSPIALFLSLVFTAVVDDNNDREARPGA